MLNIAYRSFGRVAPVGLPPSKYAVFWLLSAAFVITGLVATVVLNFFSLFVGVLVLFVNRPKVEFHFLKLFGKVPVIALAIAVLSAYTLWHQASIHGFWMIVWPTFAVWISGGVMIALCALWGAATRP